VVILDSLSLTRCAMIDLPEVEKVDGEAVWLRRSQVSKLTGLTTSWLKRAAWLGNGPPFRKVGKMPLYSRAELLNWIESHPMHSNWGIVE
jgi:hypothetical protein